MTQDQVLQLMQNKRDKFNQSAIVGSGRGDEMGVHAAMIQNTSAQQAKQIQS